MSRTQALMEEIEKINALAVLAVVHVKEAVRVMTETWEHLDCPWILKELRETRQILERLSDFNAPTRAALLSCVDDLIKDFQSGTRMKGVIYQDLWALKVCLEKWV